MKNGLSVGFASLDLFLQPQEFETVGAARRFMGDPEILDRLSRANEGRALSPEAQAFLQVIANDRGDDSVWLRIVKRFSERVYQAAVLKEIASGDDDPEMAKLLAKVDAEVDEASHALKATH